MLCYIDGLVGPRCPCCKEKVWGKYLYLYQRIAETKALISLETFSEMVG